MNRLQILEIVLTGGNRMNLALELIKGSHGN